ncbi:MAG: nucleoside triphosphate pyrophosphohydrolase, partial [Acidobacteria bacterium]|nr:nucleoside triphosphate pyrophosphohydrolase [Acidobacteriota bacterium]
LVEMMAHLRGPEGCAWDRAQDYDSVKGLLLEEVYEVVDAVNARNFDALEDELGDLLFQVVFYSRLAEEEKRFSIDDVVERVHAKLVRRHPHVFGEKRARTAEEALASWLSVKEREREADPAGGGEQKSLLDGIPASFPSTLEAYEIGVRAAEVGFDWPTVGDLLDKIEEEIRELRREAKDSGATGAHRIEEEVGDLLFAVANLARFLKSDPESCLRRANRKFQRRFQALEQEVARRGKQVRECSPQELDSIWEQIKSQEK